MEGIIPDTRLSPVRIVGRSGKHWFIDPSPQIVTQGSWCLWLYGGSPIKYLHWDPESGSGLMPSIH